MTTPLPSTPPGSTPGGDTWGDYAAKSQEDWEAEQNAEWQAAADNLLIPAGNFLQNLPTIIVVSMLTMLADLLDMVPIVGSTLSEIVDNIAAGLNQTNHTATTANNTAITASSQAITLQSTVLTIKTSRDLWDGLDPTGEPSLPFVSCTNDVVVTQGVARGAFIRMKGGDEKAVFTWLGSGNASITAFYITLYKQEANGDLTKKWQSPDIKSILLVGFGWHQYVMPSGAYLTEPGEVLLVEFRLVGAGSHTMIGHSFYNPAPLPGFRPSKPATSRNGGTGASSPDTIIDADVVYQPDTVFVDLAANVGTSSLPRIWIDNFNRTSLGINWVRRSTWGTHAEISSNAVGYVGTTDGTQSFLWVYPLNSDWARVQGELETVNNEARTILWICSNNSQTMMAALGIEGDRLQILTGTGLASLTARASLSITNVAGDGFAIEYNPADNTFYGFKNSDPAPIIEWEDTTNIVPHGLGNRFTGSAVTRVPFNNSGRITAWMAYDVQE